MVIGLQICYKIQIYLGLALIALPITFSSIHGYSHHPPTETCDNGIDDDSDGLIDLNDPDCICEIITPKSLIPNPSFEEMDCCPQDRSELDCASVWIQASVPTTDFIHTCGWLGWPNFPPPMPFPDGDGIMGFRDGRVSQMSGPNENWKEYAGACLLGPLEVDSSYRFEFEVGFVDPDRSPSINITFFGTSDCDNLPFGVGDPAFGCPTNGPNWVRLGSSRVNGGNGNKWVKTAIVVKPDQEITAIAIGPDCPKVRTDESLYYFFDNLVLADLRSFDFKIKEINHPCSEDFSISVPDNSSFTYQWYKDGVAIVGETNAEISKMYGEGKYQVRLDDGSQCRVTEGFDFTIPVITHQVTRVICKEATFEFGDEILDEPGIYTNAFTSINNCDSFVELNLKILGEVSDTVRARIFEGENYEIGNEVIKTEGNHVLNFTTNRNCDSLVLLQLSYYHVFIPSAFSPNNDGVNDVFKIFSETELIISYRFDIYDRWGTKVFEGAEWDGLQNGKAANPGLYIYIVNVVMDDGQTRGFQGDFTLIK